VIDQAVQGRISIAWIAGEVLGSKVWCRPVGEPAVPVLSRDLEHAVATDADGVVGTALNDLAITLDRLTPSNRHLVRGTLLEDDVDHAGDCIRTVLCGRTIAQNLDSLDGAGRNRVEIDHTGPTPYAAIYVDQGAHVAPLSVDQHQYLVRRQSAQRGRPSVVRTVRNCGSREVEGRREGLNDLRRLGTPGLPDLGG
jgi:hypothetical protein